MESSNNNTKMNTEMQEPIQELIQSPVQVLAEAPVVKTIYDIINEYHYRWFDIGGIGSFDRRRSALYFNIDKSKTTEFLFANWKILEFDDAELSKCINTEDKQIIGDMKIVLMLAVLQVFNVRISKMRDPEYVSNLKLRIDGIKESSQIDHQFMKCELMTTISEMLDLTIFRRTAEQTCYGFL